MPLAYSKVTSQGQISVPANVRRMLGISPGSILEWETDGSHVFVRRAGRFSSQDIHQALFASNKPAARTLGELKEGLRQRARKRYARH